MYLDDIIVLIKLLGNDGLTTSVTVNDETFEQSGGNINLGTLLRSHQSLSAYRTASEQDAIDEAQDDAIAAVYNALQAKQDTVVSQTVTIAVADWAGGTTCTKSVTGVTATSTVIVDTSDGSVECTGQGAGTLTFTATSTPTSAVTVKVVIL